MLEAGTYKWVDSPSHPQKNMEQALLFKSKPASNYSYIAFAKIYDITTDGFIRYMTVDTSAESFFKYPNNRWVYQDFEGEESNAPALQTIIIESTQTVSADFYNWAITGGNLVKQ